MASINEAAARLGVPRAYLAREVEAGRLPGKRIGNRWMVPIDRVTQILSGAIDTISVRMIPDMLADLRSDDLERRIRGMIDLARLIGAGMAIQGMDQLDAEHGVGKDLSALLGRAAAGDSAAVDALEAILTNKRTEASKTPIEPSDLLADTQRMD